MVYGEDKNDDRLRSLALLLLQSKEELAEIENRCLSGIATDNEKAKRLELKTEVAAKTRAIADMGCEVETILEKAGQYLRSLDGLSEKWKSVKSEGFGSYGAGQRPRRWHE